MSAVAPLVVRTRENDIARGTASEVVSTPVVAKLIGSAVRRNPDQFAKFDYETISGDKVYGEQKDRGLDDKTYADWQKISYFSARKNGTPEGLIVGHNKVQWLRDGNRKAVFVFKFADGYRYIWYNKDKFDTFKVAPFQRKDRNGSSPVVIDKVNNVVYIPFNELVAYS